MESSIGEAGEVRRVKLVYFLSSRSGQVDQPHLLSVHHISRNGVFLRDVKRWLAGVRGNAMPDQYCWSCKRRYKNGYVWQDLLDDDLITPISDNEYVLKGSEILLSTPKEEKKAWNARNGEIDAKENLLNPKLTSEMIHRESPVFRSQRSTATTSTLTDESTTNEEETILLKKPGLKKLSGDRDGSSNDTGSGRPSVSSTTTSSSFIKSKSHSSARVSQVIRNLIKCGGFDANDAVLVPLNKSASRGFGAAWEDERRFQYQQHNARKSFEGAWNAIKMKDTIEFCKPKVASSKPSMAPLCSHCGKSFKPEKMHSHMKLCLRMKSSLSKDDLMTGNNNIKPRQQRCRNIPGNPSGHQRVVRTTLKD
ncbi:hypothetical protein Rs2_00060 [Raphanus sativus]|uniref:Protein SOSEKI 1 n=1 Tax=Raphanus sativus TaxID=3726 RepID=A0A6J0NT64_RAPSA|nr:protein SOSEKI 1 [Raphanus sativus]KAJ4914510.1 hypothetical protein Rs2_00060 [Raphanus sativus]